MTQRNGAQIIIDALEEAGVDIAFGYPGGAIMPLYDALLDSSIQHVLTRHEQAAVHAADGYARSSGKMGVCIATSGPGATNLVTGICTAMMDSSPLLCITGQVNSALIGTDGFQEADILGIVAVVTKQCYLVRDVNKLPEIIAEAIFLARSGRPGPVLIDIPKDVLLGTTTKTAAPTTSLEAYDPAPKFEPQALTKAHELLKNAKKPVCIVGGGCRLSKAIDLFRQWCDTTQIPASTTLMGIGSTDPDYTGWLGMPGMHGLRRANKAITESDLLIAMGIRFDDRVTGKLDRFAPNAKIIHIDIDAAEIGKIVPVDSPINGDLATVLEAWLQLLEQDPIKPFTEWQQQAMSIGDGLRPAQPAEPGAICPRTMIAEVLDYIGPDTPVVTDVGQNQMWTSQRVRPTEPGKFVTSGGAGTMGFGLPSAVGVHFARPDEKVLLVAGDGGFQMTMAELATVSRNKAPIKIMILDNKFLGMVRQWQELFCDRRYSGVDLSDNPDFAKLANVYNIESFTLDNEDQMKSTIDAWWNSDGPALLHCICHKEENVFPMVPAGAGLGEMVE